MDNQILQTAILMLIIALLMVTFKYQHERNKNRKRIQNACIPKHQEQILKVENYKIQEIHTEAVIPEMIHRHISHNQVKERLANDVANYLFDNGVMEIKQDYSHNKNGEVKFKSRIFIAVRNEQS